MESLCVRRYQIKGSEGSSEPQTISRNTAGCTRSGRWEFCRELPSAAAAESRHLPRAPAHYTTSGVAGDGWMAMNLLPDTSGGFQKNPKGLVLLVSQDCSWSSFMVVLSAHCSTGVHGYRRLPMGASERQLPQGSCRGSLRGPLGGSRFQSTARDPPSTQRASWGLSWMDLLAS